MKNIKIADPTVAFRAQASSSGAARRWRERPRTVLGYLDFAPLKVHAPHLGVEEMGISKHDDVSIINDGLDWGEIGWIYIEGLMMFNDIMIQWMNHGLFPSISRILFGSTSTPWPPYRKMALCCKNNDLERYVSIRRIACLYHGVFHGLFTYVQIV